MRKLVPIAAAAIISVARIAGAAPPTVARHTCPNGLEVLVVESHANPTFTVEIAVKNGAMTEPPELNGLSHLYEHMFFKANAAIPSQEAYLARARELGLEWNGTTNNERVNYFFSTTTDHFSDAMTFMRDAITSPLFDAKELERERVVVTGEIDRNESTPQYYLWHETAKKLWFKFPSRKDALGNRATVLSATQAKMRLIQQRYYVPNNSVLVVTGDVNTKAVFDLADMLYAGWKKTADPFIANPLVKHPPLPKSEVLVVEQPVASYSGLVELQGPSTVGAEIPATYAADLLVNATTEPSSKFQKHLVESGACSAVNFNYVTQVNAGDIAITFEANPDRIETCVKAVFNELPLMKNADYFTDEDIANAGRAAEFQSIRYREKPSALSSVLTFFWTSAGLDYYLGYVDNMKKVDRIAIGKYLDTYVLGKPFVFGSMISPAMKKQGFDKARFAKLAGVAQ